MISEKSHWSNGYDIRLSPWGPGFNSRMRYFCWFLWNVKLLTIILISISTIWREFIDLSPFQSSSFTLQNLISKEKHLRILLAAWRKTYFITQLSISKKEISFSHSKTNKKLIDRYLMADNVIAPPQIHINSST